MNSQVAQDDAIGKIVRSIQRNRLGLKDPNRPIGVFMFLGSTGVSLSQRRLREASASDGGLTVGDAAVVGGYSVGDQDGNVPREHPGQAV